MVAIKCFAHYIDRTHLPKILIVSFSLCIDMILNSKLQRTSREIETVWTMTAADAKSSGKLLLW